MTKQFELLTVGRRYPVSFTEQEVMTFDDFCDPEREDILVLETGQSITLDDGAVVTRTA